MKKHLSTILLILLFFAGFCVLLYPTVSNFVNSKNQSKAIASYVNRMDEIDTSTYDAIMTEAREYNEHIKSNQGRFVISDDENDKFLHLLGSNGGAVGYLEIDSISVTLPLYLGDSPAVLRAGGGIMPGSSLPIGGLGTHAVITGHRGLPSSRLFTDLDQVTEGDIFVLHVLNETLTYQVDQIKIVDPQDLTELDIQADKDFCTLVTCTPYGINTHRLLVRGQRIENIEHSSEADYNVTPDTVQIEPMTIALIVAVPILLVIFIIIMILKHKKP